MSIKDKITFQIALSSAKLTQVGLHLASRSATSFPGMVALKIAPKFLSEASKYCKNDIITVTGTNGKTTTSGLIAAILKANSFSVLHNQKGANMPQGIASALAEKISPLKKCDYFVLENDEAYLSKIYDGIKADYLLVTNLFRDQLDRYGELETTAKKIRTAIDKNPSINLILNADDPMLHSLYTENTRTFGFEEIELVGVKTTSNAPKENVYCACGKQLKYKKNFYAHIGHYNCDCGYSRKTPDISAKAKIYLDKTELTVSYKDKTHNFVVGLPGLYNAYNALGSIAIALLIGIKPQTIQNAFATYHSVFGRAEKLTIKGKSIFVQLIKNPVGASEVIRTVSADKNSQLLIVINDDYADGRDVSWLWDADFDALKDYEGKITVSGKRAHDMALRLKYAGVKMEQVETIESLETALHAAIDKLPQTQTLHVLPTYTALLKMQEIEKKL